MKSTEFFVNKFNFIKEQPDLNFISPNLKRRMSKVDRLAFSVMNNVYSENIEYLVFSSQFGEADRLIKIISQYSKENEISPNTFSGSVHNYPAGLFLQFKQKTIPYTAITSGENSISTGLLTALSLNYKNILYCFADIVGAFALNISKNKSPGYKLSFKNNITFDNIDDYINLFENNTDHIETSLFSIERGL